MTTPKDTRRGQRQTSAFGSIRPKSSLATPAYELDGIADSTSLIGIAAGANPRCRSCSAARRLSATLASVLRSSPPHKSTQKQLSGIRCSNCSTLLLTVWYPAGVLRSRPGSSRMDPGLSSTLEALEFDEICAVYGCTWHASTKRATLRNCKVFWIQRSDPLFSTLNPVDSSSSLQLPPTTWTMTLSGSGKTPRPSNGP
jgi:hypothetical protein